jgi:hypothetical protein
VSLENEPVCESGFGKPYSAFSGKEMQILGQILLVKLMIDSFMIWLFSLLYILLE